MKRSVLILTVLLMTGCSRSPQTVPEINVGAIFPLTGNAATFGQSSKQGMQLAVDGVNARGGMPIKGVKRLIKAIYEDSEGSPEKAANACQKLLSRDRIVALIGEVLSKNSLAIAPICQDAKIPMITPASTNSKVTEAGDYIFRACFIDPFQGMVMAKFAFNNLGARRAAMIYDNGNDYNKGLAEVFKSEFTRYGGRVVAAEAFTDEANTVDYKAQLTNIKSATPDFLYSPNYYAADAIIMKQSHEIGLKVPTGGGDGWDSPQLTAIGGSDVDGCVFSNHFCKDDTASVVQDFVRNYRTRYGSDPDALASLAYDAATILLSAMEKSGSIDGSTLKATIAASSVRGVSGAISFDARRNPIKSAVILRMENGAQKYVASVSP